MNEKQLIIGENNVGKTNFIRALQLILDPQLSDQDRYLDENDFHEGLESPMESGEIIEISIDVTSFSHSRNLLCQLSDATLKTDPETLRLTYRYFPNIRSDGTINTYEFKIFKGDNEEIEFGHTDRKYLNMRVIKPLRDVENDIRSGGKKSPLISLLKEYDISPITLESLATQIHQQNNTILALRELRDLERRINDRFRRFVNVTSEVTLTTNEINASRILSTLKLMVGQRPIGNTSLGLTNVLYIALVLLQLQDSTVPTYIDGTLFNKLSPKDKTGLLQEAYAVDDQGGYSLKSNYDENMFGTLYDFFDRENPSDKGTSILVIEEPEAHLHPSVQRTIFKDVFQSNSSSILLTTHSTHIASIARPESIIHLYPASNGVTRAKSSASLTLSNAEYMDVARFLDARRGEIYFGKGVLLVEGIAEEYLVPRFADLLDMSLDYKGIIVCNIDSTNFSPYVKLLRSLGIPYAVITDGDFYELVDGNRKYHRMYEKQSEFGFLGHENSFNTLVDLGTYEEEDIPDDFNEQDTLLRTHGFFVGYYTLEVDVMKECENEQAALDVLYDVFKSLTHGGSRQWKMFKDNLVSGNYWSCLNVIESSYSHVGKGRFAQRLASQCTKEHIPHYIQDAISYIYRCVDATV